MKFIESDMEATLQFGVVIAFVLLISLALHSNIAFCEENEKYYEMAANHVRLYLKNVTNSYEDVVCEKTRFQFDNTNHMVVECKRKELFKMSHNKDGYVVSVDLRNNNINNLTGFCAAGKKTKHNALCKTSFQKYLANYNASINSDEHIISESEAKDIAWSFLGLYRRKYGPVLVYDYTDMISGSNYDIRNRRDGIRRAQSYMHIITPPVVFKEENYHDVWLYTWMKYEGKLERWKFRINENGRIMLYDKVLVDYRVGVYKTALYK